MERIEFSKPTEELRAEVSRIKTELSKIEPKITAMLADDKTDEAKLSIKIAEARASDEVLRARLGRRQPELRAAVLADYQAALTTLDQRVTEARAEWRRLRDEWQSALLTGFSDDARRKLLADSSLGPKCVENAQRILIKTEEQRSKVQASIEHLDKASFWSKQGKAAMPSEFREPDYAANAIAVCPELSGAVEPRQGLFKRIGTAISGLAGGPATLAPQV